MQKIKHHDPAVSTGVRLLIQKGYSARQIASQLGKSARTIYYYAADLGLKTKGERLSHEKGESTVIPDVKRTDREREIIEDMTKKHVKVFGQNLANKTIEHELEMRKLIVALEKHAAIFESVQEMGLSKEKFIDLCIEMGYDAAKEAYMRKVREAEEREARRK